MSGRIGHGLGHGLGLGAVLIAAVACSAPPSAPSVQLRVAVSAAAGIAGARALVAACAQAGVALEAPVARADLDGGAVAMLLDEAAARGVPVALRPVADDAVGGPAISSAALPRLARDVERLVAIVVAAPGSRATLVLELAPPRALAAEVLARLDVTSGPGRGGRLYELLATRLDERGHLADAAMLGAIVAGARAGGVSVEARLWPILVDDGRDGDSALCDALDVPVVARASVDAALPTLADGVDVVRLVATRALWGGAVVEPAPGALAAAVAALARAVAPTGAARVGLALGDDSPGALATDVAAARGAGIEDLVVDDLPSADAAWLTALDAPAAAPPPSSTGLLDDLRAAVRDADRLLGWH